MQRPLKSNFPPTPRLGLNVLLRSAALAVAVFWKRFNDRWLGVDTLTLPPGANAAGSTVSSSFADNFAFSSIDYWDARRVILQASLSPRDVVYEIGAGLGRIACLFARHKIAKVVAVELNPHLAERIRQNAVRLRGRKCPLEVCCLDAAKSELGDGTVFFFFNPFGSETLRTVLTNIHRSLLLRPRRLRVIYVNPQAEHMPVFAAQSWLSIQSRMKTLHGLDVLIFQSVAAPS